ncbi:MAG: hypothetical protein Q8R60_07230 [Mycobacteriales bacterium]|nr:hypothetical protein [Mycobacteriales bacterium]
MPLSRVSSRLGLLAGVALALLLLAPLLGADHVLVRDMVFVPRQPLTSALLGLDGVPRAVPSDLLVALAGRVVPTGWLQDLVLVGIVVTAAWGAARLVPSTAPVAALTAATAYAWSAYLHERLLLGQWALLVGWAVLPWAARAALDWRRGEPGWRAVACLAVAACGGASAGLLVGLVVVVCGRPVRALTATALVSLPWALPALLTPSGLSGGDPAGVAAFASRADTPLGVVGSLLTGGGVWAPAAVPPGRTAGLAAAVVVLLLAAAGGRALLTGLGPRLPMVAAVGLLLALLGRLPGVADALRWAVVHVPAAGLLRDGQKWLAPLVLLVAVAAGCGAAAVLERLRAPRTRVAAGALAVLAPLAALPGAAWAEGGRLTTSSYPADWEAVTARAGDGPVLVLPWGAYRAFPWTGDRTVLDPAPRFLRGRAVVDDDLPLWTGSVRGEDPLADRLDAVVSSGGPLLGVLRAEGITQVLLERTPRGVDLAAEQRRLVGLQPVVETPELVLLDVPGAVARPADRPPLGPVVAGDVLAVLLGGLAAGQVVRGARRAH